MNRLLLLFFRKAEKERPKEYAEVCKRHEVLSGRQWRKIREREVPLTASLATSLGIETSSDDYIEDE